MPVNKYIVTLEESERIQLKDIVKKGKSSARVISRAYTLLMADNNGKTDKEISQLLDVHEDTVANIRKRYAKEGLEQALFDKPRPGQPVKASPKDEAHLIALACTNPPQGYVHWTLDLLVKRATDEGRKIKRTSLYNILLRHELKPWREKNVVHFRD